MMTLWGLHKSVVVVVVDVDILDQATCNMDRPEKVVSQLSNAVQSLFDRKLFGELLSVIHFHQ